MFYEGTVNTYLCDTLLFLFLKSYKNSITLCILGSVVITVTVTGNTTTVQSIIDDACTAISAGNTFTYNGQTFTLSTYLTIDNVQYYGVNCGETVSYSRR